jgi:ABC-2 type transport system permease protein
MLQDIWTVCWKEWREYLVGQGGGRFGNLRVLALIVSAGAFIAFSSGAGWATSPIALLVSGVYFPLVLTLTMVADSFAGERERHTLETLLASRLSDGAILLGKVAALTSYGWLFGLVGAVLSIVLANIGALQEAPFFYTPSISGLDGRTALLIGVLALVMLDGALVAIALARFRRDRLVLD